MTMAPDYGKKIIILYILQILRKYTDTSHTMTQQQIVEKLRSEYGLEVNRTTVKRNIEDLINAGYEIQYNEVVRKRTDKKTGEVVENSIYTDLHYQHEFTEPELHMLIDGLLFSRSVPYKQRRQLIDKLGKLSSSYFNRRMNHMHCMSADSPANKELFYTIEVLDEAITRGKQVELTYGCYGRDLELHPGLNRDGTEKRQVINPYQMVASEGRYYLICNHDYYDNVANYRIDRIMNIVLLEDSSVKPMSRVTELENGLNLQEYIYQNLNMFTSPPLDVEFLVQEQYISLVIDFFGKHVSFHDTEQEEIVSCRLKVSEDAMLHWAVEHANIVKVVSPESLVEEIRGELRKANELYHITDE